MLYYISKCIIMKIIHNKDCNRPAIFSISIPGIFPVRNGFLRQLNVPLFAGFQCEIPHFVFMMSANF
jgi:hypothetical protein